MVWSLLNMAFAPDVKALLDQIEKGDKGRKGHTPAIDRQKAEAIIHATIWAFSCRDDSTAACYAMEALRQAIGADTVRWMVAMLDFDEKREQLRASHLAQKGQSDE